jgi:cytochrome P450
MTSVANVATFDPYDYAFHEDPYPTYAWLRENAPMLHNTDDDFWALSRHEDITRAVREDGTFSSSMGVSLDPTAWGPNAWRTMSFLAMDPPRQTRLRALVSRGFTPRRVADLTPQIERITKRHLDAALESDEFDWIKSFAGKMPMDVISELMGIPESDRDEIRRLGDLTVHRKDGVRDVTPEGIDAALTMIGYYSDLVASRRRTPTDDLTSALAAAELGKDRLTDEEIISFLFLMMVAGNETTTKLLGNAVYWGTRNPDQLMSVLADPTRVTPWVEETLRYDTSSQILARSLLTDLEVGGQTAPAGSKVLLLLGSANRDDAVFPDPDRYDLDRDTSRSLSFGGGRHYCLGANLARLEATIALTSFVKQVQSVEIDHAAAVRVHSVNVRGFSSLPMKVQVRR